MDPADAEQLRNIISNQGAVVNNHSEALQQLAETLRSLTVSMARIENQVSVLVPPPVEPTASTSSPVPIARLHEPHVLPPERYSGDLGTCRAFLIQCSLVFEQQPTSYPTDRSRVAYLMSLLTGRALDWASAVWDGDSNITHSYRVFATEMRRVFDHPVRGAEAETRLLCLRQGARSVSSAETDWNQGALRAVFKRGLCHRLRDELASRDEPEGLDGMVSLAMRIDARLRERRRETASVSGEEAGFSTGSFPVAPEPMLLGRSDGAQRRAFNASVRPKDGTRRQ